MVIRATMSMYNESNYQAKFCNKNINAAILVLCMLKSLYSQEHMAAEIVQVGLQYIL